MATTPKSVTKTTRDYFLLLPESFKTWRAALMLHKKIGYSTYKELNVTLPNYWTRSVLKGTGVPKQPCSTKNYSLKTVRAMHATRYVKLHTEYKVMQWPHPPPNPLSHETLKTTKENYALKGSDNIYEAQVRCLVKHGSYPGMPTIGETQ